MTRTFSRLKFPSSFHLLTAEGKRNAERCRSVSLLSKLCPAQTWGAKPTCQAGRISICPQADPCYLHAAKLENKDSAFYKCTILENQEATKSILQVFFYSCWYVEGDIIGGTKSLDILSLRNGFWKTVRETMVDSGYINKAFDSYSSPSRHLFILDVQGLHPQPLWS